MLRLLTGGPAGQVRFTIIDPVGLGGTSPRSCTWPTTTRRSSASRIWTEPRQIEQRLTDLTEHMENVIQKYLRNEFETIDEYNAQAGEVAEPYRVLVVANFPARLHRDRRCGRLVSIVSSGARCGVYTLISVDTTPAAARRLHARRPRAALRRSSSGRTGKLRLATTRSFEPFPLDARRRRPTPERVTEILHEVGASRQGRQPRRGALRVHRPGRRGLLDGRQPARHRRAARPRRARPSLQDLKLGKGTSQHVLIAGKTGSGKSTLLHALITNLALRYSPDEVELYLIDFKKGVEFKTYADHELPHARVIAIESEREFGLSVLQRLDAELQGAANFPRRRRPGRRRLSRGSGRIDRPARASCCIVDEFQEFFVEDDKLAQEAGAAARPPRPPGPSLRHPRPPRLADARRGLQPGPQHPRPDGVRIALQCSEADAHLILSEDNAAARLLSRPGEAIYNDANGMVEGNHIFQVVWLADDRREEYSRSSTAGRRTRAADPVERPIVFEGNVPGRPRPQPRPRTPARRPRPGPSRRGRPGLARRGGRHQGPDRGRLPAAERQQPADRRPERRGGRRHAVAPAILGLAAQLDPDTLRRSSTSSTARPSTPRSSACSPGSPRRAAPVRRRHLADAADVLGEIADEIERRRVEDTGRACRRSSSSSTTSPVPRPPQVRRRFRLLRPSRRTSRPALEALRHDPPRRPGGRRPRHRLVRQPEQPQPGLRPPGPPRVRDARPLPDEPGRLQPDRLPRRRPARHNRALFYSEEQGRLEKFRPYGPPEDAYLASVKARLHARPTPPRPIEVLAPDPEPEAATVPDTSGATP